MIRELSVNTGGYPTSREKRARYWGAQRSLPVWNQSSDPFRSRHGKGLRRGGKTCRIVETLHVDAGHSAFRVIDENIGKLRVPDNFVGAIRRARIDHLGKGLVHAGEQNQKLCATSRTTHPA